MIVYKLTNKLNGKCYIGQTIQTLENRLKQHISCGNTIISKALNKYGVDNFEITVIDNASNMKQLNSKEIFWIGFYKSLTKYNGYNVKLGGKNSRLTEEEKKIISESTKKALKKPEVKSKLGRNWTDNQRKEFSQLKKGTILSEDHKKSISKSLEGVKKSKEHSENISKGKTGLKYNWKNKFYWKDASEDYKKHRMRNNIKWDSKKDRDMYHRNKLKEKRKLYRENFKKRGKLDFIVCNENNKTYNNYKKAADDLNINVCSLREHVMGMYSNCGGYTFKAFFKNPDNEGVSNE